MEFNVTIKILSPIHLGSGQADVTVDSEIIHDEYGFPYFPAKRFKGLLYESAVEVFEMFELANIDTKNISTPEKIFHRNSDDKGQVEKVQLIVPNFYIKPVEEYEKICAEWKYLMKKYVEYFDPADILNAYTTIRYQTKLEDGITADGSLRNIRVLNAGEEFFGKVELLNADECDKKWIALALKNLNCAGGKRNRGFGRIECTSELDGLVEEFFKKGA